MSISASAPDKRPALAFDNQTEIEFLLTAIESYRQGHILETYKVDWAQLEEIIEELKKCYEMFISKKDATSYQKEPTDPRGEYIKKIHGK